MTSKHRGSINLCKPFNHLADFSQSSLTGFRCVYFLLCAVCLQSGRILCGWLLFNPLGFQCADPPWGSRLPSPDMSCISTVLYSAWPWYGQAVGYLKLQVVSARHVKRCPEHIHTVNVSQREFTERHSYLLKSEWVETFRAAAAELYWVYEWKNTQDSKLISQINHLKWNNGNLLFKSVYKNKTPYL